MVLCSNEIESSIFFRGDTHLTLHDTISDAIFKVDLRLIHDKVKQRYNMESDVAVMEVAEEDAGDNRFISDRCKVSIENETIIDRYLMNGMYIDSVDALKICGLQVFFVNTSLEESGLYAVNQFYHHSITKSLKNLEKYMDLVFELLYFRDN